MNYSKLVRFDYNRHLPKSYTDKSNDVFYILASLYIADSNEVQLTKLTLEKSLYAATQELAKLNKSFLRTHFYINTLGPHNNVFYKYLDELQRAGLINSEPRSIFITPKGLSVVSDLLNNLDFTHADIKILFKILDEKIIKYGKDYQRAINETHKQRVIDTTDRNQVKTIQQIIDEIKPEEKFTKGTQFRYIESPDDKKTNIINLSAKVLNNMESALSNVEELDYRANADISSLFA